MPRNNRLTRADFSLLLKAKTRRINGTYFTVSVLKTEGETVSKVSCVVSKKVSTRAVDRNRIKRRVREVVRPLLLDLPQPVLLMIYAKKESLRALFEETREDIATIFVQLRK